MSTLSEQNKVLEFTYYRGRVAMAALLKALGVGPGDEVAIQAFTCLAVPEGVMALGAKPVYIDLEDGGYNLCAEDLGRKITTKTKAVVVQHTFGLVADMGAICRIAAAAGVPVLEDCCHTLGSVRDGGVVGSWGAGAFYSFEWGKPVVAGLGGAARVRSDEIKKLLADDYAHYAAPPRAKFMKIQLQYIAHSFLYRPSLFWKVRDVYKLLGRWGAAESNYNPVSGTGSSPEFGWRMARPLQKRAAHRMEQLQSVERHARHVASLYRSEIDNPAVVQPVIPQGADPVFGRYPLRVADKDVVLKMAREANVELADWYSSPVHPLVPRELPLVGYELGACKEAEVRCREVVTLPTHRKVTERDVRRAIGFLNSL